MPNKGLLLLTGGLDDTEPDGTYPKGLGVETSMFEYTGFSTAYWPEKLPRKLPRKLHRKLPGNCMGNCPGNCPEYCMGLPSPGGTAGYSVWVTACEDLSLSPEAPWVEEEPMADSEQPPFILDSHPNRCQVEALKYHLYLELQAHLCLPLSHHQSRNHCLLGKFVIH
jgi:hypothetical protein